MKYALRALGWTTIIFWLCLIFFALTLVYSALNIKIKPGESQLFAKDGRIVWATSAIIDNAGLYGIYDLNFTTIIEDVNGKILLKNSSITPLIQKEETRPIWHNISVSLEEIPNYQAYLTHDTNFTVKNSVSLKFARVVPLLLSYNSTIPWGAPLYNLSISQPTFQHINETHLFMSLNVSFENHSPYINLNGTLKIEISNEKGEIAGSGKVPINVPPYEGFNENLVIPVEVSKFTKSGTIRLTFETSIFSYETEVPYESD